MLCASGLCFSYSDAVPILESIDLQLAPGDSAAIVGPGGSGKTTILKLLSGLLQPSKGRVEFEGRALDLLTPEQYADFRRKLTMTFQQGGLFDSLSVRENLEFVLRELSPAHKSDWPRMIEAVLREMGLQGIDDLAISQLSGGMQRRLGIARSLLSNPKIILMDEPTAGLDPVTGSAILDLVERLNRDRGVGLLIVASDPALIYWVNRIYFLNQHRIEESGTYKELQFSKNAAARQFFHGLAEGPIQY